MTQTFFKTQTKSAVADGPKPVCDNCDLCTQNVVFFMFPDARFQSKTNEKLICRLEHLSIDVVKLQLRLYGWNIKIHQAPVCDMCQIA